MMVEKELRSPGGGIDVAGFAQNLSRMRQRADHQRVPACDNLRIQQRLLSLEAGFVKLLSSGGNARIIFQSRSIRQMQDIFVRPSCSMMRIGKVRPAIDAVRFHET